MKRAIELNFLRIKEGQWKNVWKEKACSEKDAVFVLIKLQKNPIHYTCTYKNFIIHLTSSNKHIHYPGVTISAKQFVYTTKKLLGAVNFLSSNNSSTSSRLYKSSSNYKSNQMQLYLSMIYRKLKLIRLYYGLCSYVIPDCRSVTVAEPFCSQTHMQTTWHQKTKVI